MARAQNCCGYLTADGEATKDEAPTVRNLIVVIYTVVDWHRLPRGEAEAHHASENRCARASAI